MVYCFAGALALLAVIMGLRALALMSDFNTISYRLATLGWGRLAETIVQNKIAALWHGAFMAVCAGFFIWLFCRAESLPKGVRLAAQRILVLLVAVDALLLSRHYIKTMPLAAFGENEVIRILKSGMPEKRVALVTQEGFYNHWLTYLFPYHGIRTLNVTQMPRMPADYQRFFAAVGRDPLRLWQLSAIGFVLGPSQAWSQFQAEPSLKDAFELVYAYNVRTAGSGIEVVPATAEQPGQHVVMRLKKPAPRYALIGKWETAADDDVLRRLGSTNYALFEKVLVAPECAPDPAMHAGSSEGNQVQLLHYKPGTIRLRASVAAPAILRLADKYDPDWKAWIDGHEAPVMRVDFIFQGVLLAPGMHEIVMQYSPPRWPIALQAFGFAIIAIAAILLLSRNKRNCRHSAGT